MIQEATTMKAIILAAGEGKRFRPLTVSKPHGMIYVAGKPILEHIINGLRNANVRDIVIVVGYRRERIMAHLQDGKDFDVNITYVKQSKSLGTGDALRRAREHIDGDFLLLHSDSIPSKTSIKRLVAGEGNCMMITRSSAPSKYGFVETRGDRIHKVTTKRQVIGDITWIDTGIYRFDPSIMDWIDAAYDADRYSISHALQALSKQEKIPFLTSDHWMPTTYPWDLLEANSQIIETLVPERKGTIEQNVILKGNVFIGEGTIIRGNTYIQGPVYIGENCEIGPFTTIYPSTTVENNTSIGPYTKIKNSVVMEGCRIRSHSAISSSVISSGVSLGSNFIGESSVVSYRFEKFFEGQTSVLVSRSLGVVIGEYTRMGPSVSMLPGTVVGARCIVDTKACIRQSIPDDTRVV